MEATKIRVKGHRLDVVSSRPGTHLVACECGESIKASDGRVHKNHWRSYERPRYIAAHQAHLREVSGR